MLVAMAVSPAGCAPSTDKPELVVGVAASLRPVIERFADDFESSVDVTLVSGASGVLATQIRQGAPLDVYISADSSFTAELALEGLLHPTSIARLAHGELLAVTSLSAKNSKVDSLMMGDTVRQIAIANPALAPYGLAALRYIESSAAWPTIQKKIVYGENVAQVMQFVGTGNAELGFVPRSLFLASQYGEIQALDALPAHASVNLVVTAGISVESTQVKMAKDFMNHLQQSIAYTTWERFGYRTDEFGARG